MSLTEAWTYSSIVDPAATTASSTATPPPSSTSPPLSPLALGDSRMPPATSSLPNPKELSKEDDWTRVKDPKEKKRIQNRVAQRTYRHRMKARLGELQARLDSHEQRRAQQTTPDNSDSSSCSFTANASASNMPGLSPTSATTCGGGLESSPSPVPADKQSVSVLPPAMYEHHHHHQHHQHHHHQPADDSDPPLYTQASRYLDSPPHSHPSPPPPAPHGLLSPPGRAGPDPGAERSVKVSQDFVLDCLRFQTQLLNRLNSLQQQENHHNGFVGPPPYDALAAATTNDMGQPDHVNCVGSFTPSHADAMEFAFDDTVDVWKTEPALDHKLRHASPSTADAIGFTSLPPPPVPGHMGPSPSGVMGSSPSNAVSLDDRFESIMQHVEAAGFESFDDLVTAYYSDTFGETSPLANEQHLSRNRRLPKVVADVFRATSDWTPWERRGFHEEILKTAESMLISEASGVRGSLMAQIAPLIETPDGVVPPHAGEALLGMTKSIQNELPNSWALTMALAADNRSSWQRDRSNTALATILLLQLAGRIPTGQLLQLVGACL